MIPKGLLDVLACPRCKGSLMINKGHLKCNKCRERYIIKEGIPILMPRSHNLVVR